MSWEIYTSLFIIFIYNMTTEPVDIKMIKLIRKFMFDKNLFLAIYRIFHIQCILSSYKYLKMKCI